MQKSKAAIRKMILQRRRQLNEKEIIEKSLLITKKLIALEQFCADSLIMCYMDFKNEVMTRDFIEHCFRCGKRVAVPLVIKTENGHQNILACEINCIENDLEKGSFGILEPKRNTTRIVDPCKIDMIVVPGIAFDLNRQRIGYGAGFYDRFLDKFQHSCLTVGVAFDIQICDTIPSEEHDIPLDLIITENRII